MNLIKGRDMFREWTWNDDGPKVLCVTTNGAVRREDKVLNMGAGAALGAARLYPWLPKAAGETIVRLYQSEVDLVDQGKITAGQKGIHKVAACVKAPYLPPNVQQAYDVYNYGLLNVGVPDRLDRQVFLVQTKLDWSDPSPMGLVHDVLTRLGTWAEQGNDGMADGPSSIQYHMNFPAIGRGGLPRSMVLPWVEELPDNVFVYEL